MISLIDRYILRQIAGSFALVVGVLTAVVWLTSSLRQLDLLVTQGQTILIFLGVTLLALPLLIYLITPFALFIAFLFTLNKLNTDSELIVMSAAGLSRARLMRPMLMVALTVTAAAYLFSLLFVPASLRTLRQAVTAARADFIGQVIQPGRFTTVDSGLTVHVRDRGANGVLLGVFVNDTRDPELDMTYIGSRGIIAQTPAGTFLVLEEGQIVRKPKRGSGYGSVISFDSYAINLSAFVGAAAVTQFPAQERFTTELIALNFAGDSDQRAAGRIRSELHDRFASPLYPLAFALIAVAALGQVRTTRQSRSEGVVFAIGAIVMLRVGGFFASGLAAREAWGIALIYAIPLAGIAGALMLSLGAGASRVAALGAAAERALAAVLGPLRARLATRS
jgi:lipopolysaccharide export system permease protein